MQVHHGRWVGTSFLFIGGRKPTYVDFLLIGGRKPTYVGFLLESTRKGHLIPGAVVFSIRRSRIFHSKFFSLKNPCPSDNRRGGRIMNKGQSIICLVCSKKKNTVRKSNLNHICNNYFTNISIINCYVTTRPSLLPTTGQEERRFCRPFYRRLQNTLLLILKNMKHWLK